MKHDLLKITVTLNAFLNIAQVLIFRPQLEYYFISHQT